MVKEVRNAARNVKEADSVKRVKTNRTLSLDYQNFEQLSDYCRSKDVKVSNLIDELIAAYLAEVK